MDTGLAIVLICLLLIYFFQYNFLLLPAIAVLITIMTSPGLLAPAAKIWLGFSHLLGSVMSRVILTVIFYGVAMPVGLLRRLAGADPMLVRAWKKGSHSVFKERNHTFSKSDVEKPY